MFGQDYADPTCDFQTVDKAGLVVEKGLPAMIVLCHFPFMAK
jgi:hypothetical protein